MKNNYKTYIYNLEDDLNDKSIYYSNLSENEDFEYKENTDYIEKSKEMWNDIEDDVIKIAQDKLNEVSSYSDEDFEDLSYIISKKENLINEQIENLNEYIEDINTLKNIYSQLENQEYNKKINVDNKELVILLKSMKEPKKNTIEHEIWKKYMNTLIEIEND